MLPFLKPKKLSAVIIHKVKPEGGTTPEGEEGEPKPELMSIAESLISAVHSKDAAAVADALEAAVHACMGEEKGEME